MINYVLGFAFNGEGRVALIRKTHPDWQRGRLNGVGGRMEDYEEPTHAMRREFEEETGVDIEYNDWREVGYMHCKDLWTCVVFAATHPSVAKVRSTTEETIGLYTSADLNRSWDRLIENVPALIELCRMAPGHSGTIPFFTLDYSRG